MAWYYTFNPIVFPNGYQHTKPGITESVPIGRLGKYQLPYGPFWEASYSWLCYHEDPKVIRWIENTVLGYYRHRCCTLGAGMSEWLMNTSWEEIRNCVLEICRDNNIQIVDYGPGPWNPVKIQNEILNKI
jgi:hypothetical protein